jgi:hypothetical protein
MLVVIWALRLVRAIRHLAAEDSTDRPAEVLRLATRRLPVDRAAWGEAMLAELCEPSDPRGRWRFSLGCVRTATAMRVRATLAGHDRGGDAMRAVLLGTVLAAGALTVYGLVRYPALSSRSGAGSSGAGLVAMLAIDAVSLLTLLRGAAPQVRRARRLGLVGGIVVGVAWLVVLSPGDLKSWVAVPLLIALACPAVVAADTARRRGAARTAAGSPTAAAAWTGIVGGLVVFVVWATATYLRGGRPYDAQLVRDFHRSGAHDLATYAIAGNLDSAVGLLVVIPIVCIALGSVPRLTAVSADGRGFHGRRHRPRQ